MATAWSARALTFPAVPMTSLSAARRRHAAATCSRSRSSFAGLTAALRLVEAGHSVVVLEARDRVGGRALNHQLGGGEISERGATFAGPTQDRILALARQFGVGKFPTYDQGDNVYINSGGM